MYMAIIKMLKSNQHNIYLVSSNLAGELVDEIDEFSIDNDYYIDDIRYFFDALEEDKIYNIVNLENAEGYNNGYNMENVKFETGEIVGTIKLTKQKIVVSDGTI